MQKKVFLKFHIKSAMLIGIASLMKISSPLHGAIKYIPSFVSWIGGWLVGLSVGSMVLFSCYVHFFTQDVNTHCVKIRCLNLCSQDVIQTKSPIPEPPLYLLEKKQKHE